MATLQHKIRDQFVEELEISLAPSEFYDSKVGQWVEAKVAFRFWSGFPEISIRRSGQEINDVERLIGELRGMLNGDKNSVDFYPLEPDYHFSAEKNGSYYDIFVVLDATGSQKTGVYCGLGPAIFITADNEDLTKFVDELGKELGQVKDKYQIK